MSISWNENNDHAYIIYSPSISHISNDVVFANLPCRIILSARNQQWIEVKLKIPDNSIISKTVLLKSNIEIDSVHIS